MQADAASGAGFSLRGLVLASTNPNRLKPVLLQPVLKLMVPNWESGFDRLPKKTLRPA
jgi:hypothetical protein